MPFLFFWGEKIGVLYASVFCMISRQTDYYKPDYYKREFRALVSGITILALFFISTQVAANDRVQIMVREELAPIRNRRKTHPAPPRIDRWPRERSETISAPRRSPTLAAIRLVLP